MNENIERLKALGFSPIKAYFIYHEILKNSVTDNDIDKILEQMEENTCIQESIPECIIINLR